MIQCHFSKVVCVQPRTNIQTGTIRAVFPVSAAPRLTSGCRPLAPGADPWGKGALVPFSKILDRIDQLNNTQFHCPTFWLR